MAPAVQNVDSILDTDSQIKIKLLDRDNNNYKVNSANDETVVKRNVNGEVSDIDFDIGKFEATEFKAQIRWPDLIVQVLLHSVTIYGFFLILTNRVKFLTTLFGE